jgi:2-C-methyl-D-erythritol 2,4-cyclodiphosphate synthase
MMRIGIGYDVHAFISGRPLVLGGVHIPYAQGLDGHSDADAVIHAVVDALLGAAALGDIGQHFPSSDPRWQDVPSTSFLAYTRDLLTEHGWHVGNIDVTIVAERPKMTPHVPAMKETLAAALGIPLNEVSVKATTTDRLGFTGRGEGIAAMAVATVERG